MAEVSKTKLKLLYLMDIFLSKTDDENILNANELCDELEKNYNITAERKSIYRDIEALKKYGMDINFETIPKKGYYLANRNFEVAEVKLLIDAVQSANFITPKKTNQLIEKICKELSLFQAEKLKQCVCVESRAKRKNERVYYNVSFLNEAIENKKQVEIIYVKHIRDKEEPYKRIEKTFIVSPYALVWKNDFYYLVCNNQNYNNLMHIRIDRIEGVTVLDVDARPFSEVCEFSDEFDCGIYSKRTFNMFSGENKSVELICDNTIIDDIFDRFGDEAIIEDYDDNNFLISVKVAMSTGLVSWIMQYSKFIKVQKPEELKLCLLNKIDEISAMYR